MSFLDYSTDETAFTEIAPRAAAKRYRVHPLTWVAAAGLIPILCWDAWQSLQEAKQRVHMREGTVQLDNGARSTHLGR